MYEDAKLAAALYALLDESDESAHPRIIRGFVAFLTRKRLLTHAPRIVRAFAACAETKAGARLVMETAHDIAFPGIERRTRPDLIGGALVRRGDTAVDASIRGRIARLRRSVTGSQ